MTAEAQHTPSSVVLFAWSYSETFDSHDSALTRERQLNHWSHGKKETLIDGNLERLKQLSRRRS